MHRETVSFVADAFHSSVEMHVVNASQNCICVTWEVTVMQNNNKQMQTVTCAEQLVWDFGDSNAGSEQQPSISTL